MKRLLHATLFVIAIIANPSVSWGKPISLTNESTRSTITIQDNSSSHKSTRITETKTHLTPINEYTRRTISIQDERTLSETATQKAQDTHESVRVIVEVAAPFQPEGELASVQAVAQQHATIAQTQDALLNRIAHLDAESVTQFRSIPYIAMTVDQATLDALQSDPAIRSISEDIVMQPTLADDAPLIGTEAVWDDGFTGKGWTVAVLDSGVEQDHPFLKGKVVEEACFSSDNERTGATSLCPNGETEQIGEGAAAPCRIAGCYHGTHVAGIVAGKNNDFAGVARDASIIAVQVFRNNPSSCGTDECLNVLTSDLIRALEYIYELRDTHKIAAINLSFGSSPLEDIDTCDQVSKPVKDMVDMLLAADIVTVASSGNDGVSDGISFPGCLSNIISVGATNTGSLSMHDESVASFSNSATFLDLLAPGVQISSSVPDNEFKDLSGTSMAVPHVAGAWAILKSSVPDATPEQIFTVLQETGVPINDSRNDIIKPRIQLDAAVNALRHPVESIPEPPINLSANTADKDSIELTWENSNHEQRQFTIERREQDGTSWETIDEVTIEATSYADQTEVICDTTYTYRIRAFDTEGSFTYSNTTSTTTSECLPDTEDIEDETTNTAEPPESTNHAPHPSTELSIYLPLVSRS